MLRRLSHLIRDLSGHAHTDLLTHLTEQLQMTAEGVEIARELAAGQRPPAPAHHDLQVIEERGDACRRDLIGALAVTLSAPIC